MASSRTQDRSSKSSQIPRFWTDAPQPKTQARSDQGVSASLGSVLQPIVPSVKASVSQSNEKKRTAENSPVKQSGSGAVASSGFKAGKAPFKKGKIRKIADDQRTLDVFLIQPAPVRLEGAEKVLDLAKKGKNVFFTGSAGVGKSQLLGIVLDALSAKYKSLDRVSITAPTAIAATAIGGCTLCRCFRIGIYDIPVDDMLKQMAAKAGAIARVRRMKSLIIDDMGSMTGQLFYKLYRVCQRIRKSTEPWGGIQVIGCGDFLQMGPIPPSLGPDREGVEEKLPKMFAFESEAWGWTFDKEHVVLLSTVYRQTDPTFIKMLDRVRKGKMDDEVTMFFLALSRPLTYSDGVEPTKLFPVKGLVTSFNVDRLNGIRGVVYSFTSQDRKADSLSTESADNLMESIMAERVLSLKRGAQVMLTKSRAADDLVNGNVGKVIGFCSAACFYAGGMYDGPFHAPPGKGVFPVVDFPDPADVGRMVRVLIEPVLFKVEDARRKMLVERKQLPLILAWAMTIHRAQGQSIHRVYVDLGRVFAAGQAYVALSRATTTHGLEVLNFNPAKVIVDRAAALWVEEAEDQDAGVIDLT